MSGNRLENPKVIFEARPKTGGGNHYGSRLLFAPDGTLFITLGDRFTYRDEAQNTANHLGKVIRINDDGSVPKDNPFAGKAGARRRSTPTATATRKASRCGPARRRSGSMSTARAAATK